MLVSNLTLSPEAVEAVVRSERRYLAQTAPPEDKLVVSRARGSTIETADGRAYLDFIAGIAVNNVGHAHPAVCGAIAEQIKAGLHFCVYGKYVVPVQVELARRLAEVMPGPLETTFLTNSGTEAIEGALKLARKYTGRSKLVTFERAFHGRTFGSLSVSWREAYRNPFKPLLPDVHFIPFNDLDAARKTIDDETAGVIVEPIQGESGIHPASDTFLPGLRELCDRQGALLIFDEVQSGFGRTGRFFACEHWDVVPDVLVMAKAMGSGMPVGGFASRPEVMSTLMEPPLSHITTFGGHPVSCAAAIAGLNVIRDEGLVQRAAAAGDRIQRRLRALQDEIGRVREVRGKGLMLGLELNSDEFTQSFVARALELGLILGWTIYSGSTVRIAPPLVVTDEELNRGMAIVEQALKEAGGAA